MPAADAAEKCKRYKNEGKNGRKEDDGYSAGKSRVIRDRLLPPAGQAEDDSGEILLCNPGEGPKGPRGPV